MPGEQTLRDIEVASGRLLLNVLLSLGLRAVYALPFRPCIPHLMLPVVAVGNLRVPASLARCIFELLL